MSINFRIILRFVILVLVQVLVLNHIGFGGYMNPYIYVLFILMLPFSIPGWLLLVLSFFLGVTVDVFSNTGGVHAAASVLMAFARPGLIKLYFPKTNFEPNAYPGLKSMGFSYFTGFSLALVFLHHLALFYLEIFRFTEFGFTFLRAMLSTMLSMVFILITQYLFMSKTNK